MHRHCHGLLDIYVIEIRFQVYFTVRSHKHVTFAEYVFAMLIYISK
jgi:hypothetical protein